MGCEDEIVINLAISQLEESQNPDEKLDPKLMQVHLTGMSLICFFLFEFRLS